MSLPILIEASELADALTQENLLIIDLCSAESYAEGHIADAVHVPPSALSCGIKPAPGKLPTVEQLQNLLQSIGLNTDKHVVVYDDAAGTWAGRLLWTLDLLDFPSEQMSFVNGGIAAWKAAGLPLTTEATAVTASDYTISNIDSAFIADKDEILSKLDSDNFIIWDARSEEEYAGTKVLAARGGHIPGAVSYNFTRIGDATDSNRIRDLDAIRSELEAMGLTADKEIVTHCQTHRRSGLTYFVAKKLLGYTNIKAYPGSWSEWGNAEDTPIES